MSHLLTWRGRGLWPILQPATSLQLLLSVLASLSVRCHAVRLCVRPVIDPECSVLTDSYEKWPPSLTLLSEWNSSYVLADACISLFWLSYAKITLNFWWYPEANTKNNLWWEWLIEYWQCLNRNPRLEPAYGGSNWCAVSVTNRHLKYKVLFVFTTQAFPQ